MSRMTPFSSPLLLGFDAMEKTLERLAKTGDCYPPYNIERLRRRRRQRANGCASRWRWPASRRAISMSPPRRTSWSCAAGRRDDTEREFLHRGIAARQFQRCFVLADGMRVIAAELKNGLLAIDLDRPEPRTAGTENKHFGERLNSSRSPELSALMAGWSISTPRKQEANMTDN